MIRSLLLPVCFCALASLSHAEVVVHPRGCSAAAAWPSRCSTLRSARCGWRARGFVFREFGRRRAGWRYDSIMSLCCVTTFAGRPRTVYNANSGGCKTRVQPRSIAGWPIVDPLRREGDRAMMSAAAARLCWGSTSRCRSVPPWATGCSAIR